MSLDIFGKPSIRNEVASMDPVSALEPKEEKKKDVHKKLTQPKFDYGALVVNHEIVYALHVTAQIVTGGGLFGSLSFGSSGEDETPNEVFNTVLLAKVDPKTKEVNTFEITESHALFEWLQGSKAARYEAPTYLNEQLSTMVSKSMATFKGCLKDFHPLTSELLALVQADPILTPAISDFSDAAVQLHDAVAESKKMGGNIGLDGFIERYAFNNHILLAGPRGVGKTFKVSQYAEAHSAEVVQLNGHNGIESIDILGYNIRASDGSFVWLDGPLTEAFRKAQSGQVILIIDELLRINSRELNIFISSLTPNSSNEFVLNTSRVIDIEGGIGRTEILKVPAENLWVVATTNVGSDYDTDDMDLALADRFITFDVLMEESVIHNILSSVNSSEKNFDEIHISRLVNFFKSIESLVQSQELPHGINTRHLTKVLKLVNDPKEFKTYLMDFVANVVSRQTDGNLNEAEVKIYKEALTANFGR